MKISDIILEDESLTVPEKLYHVSSNDNRESIQKVGLSVDFDGTGLGAVYATDTLPEHHPNFDVWEIDTRALEAEADPDGVDQDENWYAFYDSIPPNLIRLVTA